MFSASIAWATAEQKVSIKCLPKPKNRGREVHFEIRQRSDKLTTIKCSRDLFTPDHFNQETFETELNQKWECIQERIKDYLAERNKRMEHLRDCTILIDEQGNVTIDDKTAPREY